MPENQHIEWKASWRDEYLRWICGFANADGGVLHIGRSDKGKVIGLPDAAKLMKDIPNKVRDILGIVVEANLRTEAGKDYVEIIVEPYPYPVSYKGEYHYRSGSTKQELKGAALDRFLLRKQGRHWDGVPVPHVHLEDLDAQALAYFRKQANRSKRLSAEILAEADDALIEKLHLREGERFKRAAVLLFHPDPEHFVTGAYVKIGYFESNADLLYQDEMHGPLFAQVNKTLDLLLTKYMRAMISYEGVQRVETYPVPEAALREAVLNAVVHKDYATGAPIQISVYKDKLMIWNPGQLPPDWTLDNLLGKHSSQPFNPDVANAFFRAGMIESWGRGIERIFEACQKADAPLPALRLESTGLWITFTYVSLPEGTSVEGGTTRETTQETTQEKIITLLKGKPSMTRKELATNIGISEDGVKYHLDKMKQDGTIRRVGSTKGGHWEVLK